MLDLAYFAAVVVASPWLLYRLLVVDTVGELRDLYAAADIARRRQRPLASDYRRLHNAASSG